MTPPTEAGTAAISADVLVLGLGPAGRAVASACAAAGLDVAAVDPHPDAPWSSTYGAWADELVSPVPRVATIARPTAWSTRAHHLHRAYTVLDSPGLQQSLHLTGVRVHQGAARPDARALTDGTALHARVVLDARGAPAAGRTQQTAYGVVVDAALAEAATGGLDALFMDWRTDHGADLGTHPTFLYAVPVGGGRVLLEETSLAARPGLGMDELARRLRARLAARGVRLTGAEPVERVRFALDTPLPVREWAGRPPGVVRLGAAAPLVHPASGYSVAAALRLGPVLAQALAAGAEAPQLQQLVWPARARAVHALRLRGLRTLLSLAPPQVPEFFAAFLDLPPHHQQAYLSGREDLAGTAAAMRATLAALSPPMRKALLRGALLG
ncbi:lycopene cyclase family protein [Rhodococcus sp. X156]|uniref:lycopene cyclase family protein n=1 Tax=Rhodococcus sp. X156 TaxID=2499145 RepID=UPI0013E2880A|nr:lycopene cyclase family protein [Rhodococcus sp. X156]